MWGGFLLFLSLCQFGWSYYNNEDAAYILDRLLSDYNPDDHYSDIPADYQDYLDIRAGAGPVPGHHDIIGSYDSPSHVQHVNHHGKLDQDADQLQALPKFPILNPKQKQFAVNPGMTEFGAKNPDFLQYRLEELDEPEEAVDLDAAQPAAAGDVQLEEQLQSILGALTSGDPSAADKRAMLGVVRAAPLIADDNEERSDDFFFTSIVAGATAASVFVVLGVGYCYHRTALRAKAGEDVEYPAYGVTGPAKDCSPAGDRKLAQSAQMYHYQHQKNQMISINRTNGAPGHNDEESDAEADGEEGDYTVYECPGLASTDEMEVKNPLFHDDPTPKNQ